MSYAGAMQAACWCKLCARRLRRIERHRAGSIANERDKNQPRSFLLSLFALAGHQTADRMSVSAIAITLYCTAKVDRNELVKTLRLPTGVPFKKHVFTRPMRHPQITQAGFSVSRIEVFDWGFIGSDRQDAIEISSELLPGLPGLEVVSPNDTQPSPPQSRSRIASACRPYQSPSCPAP
jgi:hypothetical protein